MSIYISIFAITTLLMLQVVTGQPQPDMPSCFQGNKTNVTDCCKLPPIREHVVVKRCMPMHAPKLASAPGINKTEGSCIAQCMLKVANAFKNNTVEKEAINSTLQSMFGSDVNFAPLIDGIVEQCHSLVSSNAALKATPVSQHPDRPACSFLPEAFVNCVGSSFIQQCPIAAWTNSDDCNQFKQKLDSGCSIVSLI